MPDVAVAFVIREKFSWALASLKRLYALAGAPFTLYFVDGVYPQSVRAEIDAFLGVKDNVVRLEAERFLYPSEALNLVVERLREHHVLLLQNDVLISRDSLAHLLETAHLLGCDVVAPQTLDMEQGRPEVHRLTDRPRCIAEEDQRIYVERAWTPEVLRGRTRLHHFELHCALFSTAALRTVHPLPPLNTREHIDLAVAFWKQGLRAYQDDRAQAVYMPSPPLPLREYECDYFRFRWDLGRARLSHEYVENKWRLADMQSAMRFVEQQNEALAPERVLRHDAGSETDSLPDQFIAASTA